MSYSKPQVLAQSSAGNQLMGCPTNAACFHSCQNKH
jgi:hypothetical protein